MKKLSLLLILMVSPVYAIDLAYEQQPGSIATPYSTTIDKRVISAHSRNAVIQAHVNSLGQPDFITPSVNSITLDGSSTPILLTIADGFNQYGQVDYVLSLKSKVVLNPASSGWLYGLYNSNTGVLTVKITNISPISVPVLPNSASTGQLVWTTVNQKMFTWDGAAWVDSPAIIFGQYYSTGSFVYSIGGTNGTVVSSGTFSGYNNIISVNSSNFTSSNTINSVTGSNFTNTNTINATNSSTFTGQSTVNTASSSTFTGNSSIVNAEGTISGTIVNLSSGTFNGDITINSVDNVIANSTTTVNNNGTVNVNNYGTTIIEEKKKAIFNNLTVNSLEILNVIQ